MKSVFVGGSRRVSRLNADIRQRLDRIVEGQLRVCVGDANGADKSIQEYLSERQYPHVVVFCTADQCRNNIGQWPVRSIEPPHNTRDFAFFSAKDAAMACEADFGFMLWDGESPGTIVNVARMVSASKPVVLYISPRRLFVTLKERADLEKLLRSSSPEVAAKVRKYISEHAREFAQPTIFGSARVTVGGVSSGRVVPSASSGGSAIR
jgi:hypothetical protein